MPLHVDVYGVQISGFFATTHWRDGRGVQRIHKDVIPQEVTYVIGRDDIVTNGRARLTRVQKAVFAFMSRNAEFAGEHLGIPPHRVQESGGQVAL